MNSSKPAQSMNRGRFKTKPVHVAGDDISTRRVAETRFLRHVHNAENEMKRSDPFERELVEAHESGKLRSVATKSEFDRLRAAARATATKIAVDPKESDSGDDPSGPVRSPPPGPSGR